MFDLCVLDTTGAFLPCASVVSELQGNCPTFKVSAPMEINTMQWKRLFTNTVMDSSIAPQWFISMHGCSRLLLPRVVTSKQGKLLARKRAAAAVAGGHSITGRFALPASSSSRADDIVAMDQDMASAAGVSGVGAVMGDGVGHANAAAAAGPLHAGHDSDEDEDDESNVDDLGSDGGTTRRSPVHELLLLDPEAQDKQLANMIPETVRIRAN